MSDDQQLFSDSERARLREIAREHEHRTWLRDLLKRWAQWAAAIALGLKVGWDALSALVREALQ